MFTKKTRVLSALLTVCMLISLLACFVVPVNAVSAEPSKGLVDTSGMIDLNTVKFYRGNINAETKDSDLKSRTYGGWDGSLSKVSDNSKGTKYKITDRKGLEVFAAICSTYSCTMVGNYVYLANDIDMEWVNFKGVAQSGSSENGHYAFKGTFDGNGFVIKNLLINQPNSYRVGLINHYYGGDGGVIRNVAIANGLIIGGKKYTGADTTKYFDGVGSIVGDSWKGTLDNCWSAATVLSTSGAVCGGLVGRSSRSASTVMNNCYFLGSVNNATDTGKYGLSGQPTSLNATASFIYNGNTTSGALGAVTQSVEGYTVKYVDTPYGYPALAYCKNGEDAPYISRVLTKTDAYKNAWDLNKAGISGFWKLGSGLGLEAANAATATYRLSVKKLNMGIAVGEEYYIYANGGTSVDVPAAEEGYALTTAPAGFTAGAKATMPAADSELVYTASKLDFDVVRTIKAEASRYNPEYFDEETEDTLVALLEACDAILAEAEKPVNEQNKEVIDANTAIIGENMEALESASLKITGASTFDETNAVYVPDYSKYDLYQEYNPANIWGVSTKEDWIALTKAGTAVKNYTIVFKADIDMENVVVAPLGVGGDYNGKMYGLGHKISNLHVVHGDGISPITCAGGFISWSNGGAMYDLIFENGLVEVIADPADANIDDDYGAGFVLGGSYIDNGFTMKNVVVGPDCTLKVTHLDKDLGASIGGLSGRSNNIKIDGCVSMVRFDIEANFHVGQLNGWGRAKTCTSNSYAVVHPENVNVTVVAARTSTSEKEWGSNGVESVNNVLMIGEGDVTNNPATIVTNGMVLPADVSAAEIAYRLNEGYAAGIGARTWFVVKDGVAVPGEELDKPVKATVDANGDLIGFYAQAGETVTLDIGYANVDYELVSGKDAVLEGNRLTFGYSDVEVKVTSLLTNALDKAVALYLGKDLSYFANPEAIKLKLELVSEKSYVNQEAVNKDAKDLVDLYVPASDKAFPASYGVEGFAMGPITFEGFGIEGNDAFPIVGVNNVADLLYVAAHAGKYSKSQTIVLNNDIDLAGSDFVVIKGLTASFDGQGHSIKNYSKLDKAFFEAYVGASIKNVTFEGGSVTLNNRECGYLLYPDHAENILVENVTFRNINVTGTGKTYFGMVVAAVRHAINIKNVTVENCTVDAASAYNVGIVVGSVMTGKTLNLENIIVRNNNITNTRGESGYLIGAYDGGTPSTVNAKNLMIYGNKGGANVGIFYGEGFVASSKSSQHQFNVENALVYGNVARELISGRTSDSHKPPVFTATNVFTDNDKSYDIGTGATTNIESAGVTLLETEVDAALIYNLNKELNEKFYAMSNAGAEFATETAKAPVKVTFGDNGPLFYTDATGKLIGDTSVIADLTECSFSVEDPANASYDVDTNVVVYSHYLAEAECHNVGEHTGLCIFCEEEFTFPCMDAEGYPKDYSDAEIKSAKAHKCVTCGNEWLTDIVMNPATLATAESFVAPAGTQVVVPVTMINDPGMAAMEFEVKYDADAVELVGIEMMDKTCEVSVAADEGIVIVVVTNRYADVPLSTDAEGNLFKVTFAVKDTAADGETAVAIDFTAATDAEGNALTELGDAATKLDVHHKTVGDFDDDGLVDTRDASQIMQYLLGGLEDGSYDLKKGDINGDGLVDLIDVVELLRTLA